MFQHFHAGDDVPRASIRRLQLPRHAEYDAGEIAKPRLTSCYLIGIHVDSPRFRESVVHHRDKCPIAAPIVQQPSSAARDDEAACEREAAAVAPRHDATRAMDLFAGIMPGGHAFVEGFGQSAPERGEQDAPELRMAQ